MSAEKGKRQVFLKCIVVARFKYLGRELTSPKGNINTWTIAPVYQQKQRIEIL